MKKLLLLTALFLACLCPLTASALTPRTDSLALVSLNALKDQAEKGSPNAIFRLSRALEAGYGAILPKDSVKARKLLEKAANLNYAPAQNYLGFKLFSEQKTDSAINWLMLAADNGDITAYSNLGWMLLNGKGAVPDPEKAIYWLKKGADKGAAPAATMLADLLQAGNDMKPDTAQALHYYNLALQLYANSNSHDRAAIHHIDNQILRYLNSDSLSVDSLRHAGFRYLNLNAPLTAQQLLLKAADRGDPKAMARLAKEYALGQKLPYSHANSLLLYTKAALLNLPAAQFIIGELLQMLPDALAELPPDTAALITPQMTSAQYWLQKAEMAGISSAHQAEQQLMDPL